MKQKHAAFATLQQLYLELVFGPCIGNLWQGNFYSFIPSAFKLILILSENCILISPEVSILLVHFMISTLDCIQDETEFEGD